MKNIHIGLFLNLRIQQRNPVKPLRSPRPLLWPLILLISTLLFRLQRVEMFNLPFQKGSSVACQGKVNMMDHFPGQPELANCIKCDCNNGIVDNCRQLATCDRSLTSLAGSSDQNHNAHHNIPSQHTSSSSSSSQSKSQLSNKPAKKPRGHSYRDSPSHVASDRETDRELEHKRISAHHPSSFRLPTNKPSLVGGATSVGSGNGNEQLAPKSVGQRSSPAMMPPQSGSLKISSRLTFDLASDQTDSKSELDNATRDAVGVFGPEWTNEVQRKLERIRSRTSTTTTTTTPTTTEAPTTTESIEDFTEEEDSQYDDDVDPIETSNEETSDESVGGVSGTSTFNSLDVEQPVDTVKPPIGSWRPPSSIGLNEYSNGAGVVDSRSSYPSGELISQPNPFEIEFGTNNNGPSNELESQSSHAGNRLHSSNPANSQYDNDSGLITAHPAIHGSELTKSRPNNNNGSISELEKESNKIMFWIAIGVEASIIILMVGLAAICSRKSNECDKEIDIIA